MRRDCVFLAIIVALSFLPYVRRLGFSSDNWAYVGSLNSFGNYSNVGRSTSFDVRDHIRQRPTQSVYTQSVYTWLLFRLFRLNPLGNQLVNGLVLIGMTVLLHLVLLELPAMIANRHSLAPPRANLFLAVTSA